MNRTLKAFLIAPLVPVFGYLIFFGFLEMTSSHGFNGQRLLNMFAIFMILGCAVSYAISLFIAAPIYLLYRNLGIINWQTIISTATILGCLFIFFVEIWPYLPFMNVDDGSNASFYSNGCQRVIDNILTSCGYRRAFSSMAVHGLLGAVTGLVFWRIYVASAKQS